MPMTTTQLVAQPDDYERARQRANVLAFQRKDAAEAEWRMAEARTAKRLQLVFWAGVVAVAIGGVIVWGMQ